MKHSSRKIKTTWIIINCETNNTQMFDDEYKLDVMGFKVIEDLKIAMEFKKFQYSSLNYSNT